jgi:hypothetical protein
VVLSPHDATPIRKDGKTDWQIDDDRVSVTMQEESAALTLFFDPATAWGGEAPLLEVRLTPTAGGNFEPWRLLPRLPLHLQYARATLAHKRENVVAALRALQQVNTTRRGLSDDFLRLVAELYRALVAEGEQHPGKALAEMQHVDKSTASRWITAARRRGMLEEAQ